MAKKSGLSIVIMDVPLCFLLLLCLQISKKSRTNSTSDTNLLKLRSYGGDKQEFMLKKHESSLALPINRYLCPR